MRPTLGIWIDIFSHCNLRCPSCVIGNKFGDIRAWPKGYMAPEKLAAILDKAQSEMIVPWVGLYNWTEPMLHPRLAEMVRVVSSRGIECLVSSNLNVLRNEDEVLAAGLRFFRISLSGFTQDVYARGHAAGDVETVKENMIRLARARDRVKPANTYFQVFYHRYAYNELDIAPMKSFAEGLGFSFETTLAQLYPVEKLLAIHNGEVSDADRKILGGLALPADEALRLTSIVGSTSCGLQDGMLSLDVEGNVMLCCGSSMERENSLGSFLDHSIKAVQSWRRSADLCGPCLQAGIPDYFASADAVNANPQFELIASERIEAHRLQTTAA